MNQVCNQGVHFIELGILIIIWSFMKLQEREKDPQRSCQFAEFVGNDLFVLPLWNDILSLTLERNLLLVKSAENSTLKKEIWE